MGRISCAISASANWPRNWSLCARPTLKSGALIPGIVKPGVDTLDLLKFVEDEYTKRNVAQYWLHNFGHGLALTIHEFPRIAGGISNILKENMVSGLRTDIGLVPPWGHSPLRTAWW